MAHHLPQGRYVVLAGVGLALAAGYYGLTNGTVSISATTLWQLAAGTVDDPVREQILLQLRGPRVVAAFIVGGLLALAGTLMQTLVRNPLADPFILGTSGGAATGALLGLTIFHLDGPMLSLTALVGATLSAFLVFGLAAQNGHWSATRLLLTGVVIATGWGAVISFLLVTRSANDIQSIMFWLLGDLSRVQSFTAGGITLVAGLCITLIMAPRLDILSQGDLRAATLGVPLRRTQTVLFLLSSALTAAAVAIAGTIGFIGLITPHLVRLLGARGHRNVAVCATLFGGALLAFADTAARSWLTPTQLPVGVVTALFGVPFFLYLLRRGYRS